jgi:hypothetical protein
MANKAHRKKAAKKQKAAKKRQPSDDVIELHTPTGGVDQGTERVIETEYLVDKYVPKKKRPTHRLPILGFMPSLPLIGKKVLPYEM